MHISGVHTRYTYMDTLRPALAYLDRPRDLRQVRLGTQTQGVHHGAEAVEHRVRLRFRLRAAKKRQDGPETNHQGQGDAARDGGRGTGSRVGDGAKFGKTHFFLLLNTL